MQTTAESLTPREIEAIAAQVADRLLPALKADLRNEPLLLTREQLSRRLGVCVATVSRWQSLGTIPCVKVAHGTVRYDLADVIAALKGQAK